MYQMDTKKVFTALCASLITYAVSSAIIGQTGFLAKKELEQERERLTLNMEKLRGINSELKETLDALRSDIDIIALQARELGYAPEDERFLRIEGMAPVARKAAPVGDLLSIRTPSFIPDLILRIVAILTGISVFVISMGSSLRISKYRRHTHADFDLSR